MAFVKVAAQTLHEIRDVLVKTAELEKRAEALIQENEVYQRTLSLVAQGLVDPAVAMEKVAEFKADKSRLDIFETAMTSGMNEVTKLGTAVDDVSSSSGNSPEEKYVQRLRNATDGLGFTLT